MAKAAYTPQGKGLAEPGSDRRGTIDKNVGGLTVGKNADKWYKQYQKDHSDLFDDKGNRTGYDDLNIEPVKPPKATAVASKVVTATTGQTKQPAQPKAPAAPKQSFLNKVGDQFKANTPADQFRREQAGQPKDFGTQKTQKKQLSERVQSASFTPEEVTARSDFYKQNGIDLGEAVKQKQAYDSFKQKYKGQSLAKLTMENNPDLKAAQAWEKTQKKLPKVEQSFQDQSNKTVQAGRGIVKGGLNVAGNLVSGSVEAINKHVVEPFVSAPAGALGAAAADATSGKGFDFRKQYQAIRHEPDQIKAFTKWVDQKTGLQTSQGAEYGDKNPIEVLTTTGLVLADVATDGALTPFIAPALTAYYAPKYVKSVPGTINAIKDEKDTTKKFDMATQFIINGALLAKGASDTVGTGRSIVSDVKGTTPEGETVFKTEKTGTQKTTVPNDQAREFFNSSNPSITPETTQLLTKALGQNKSQFVQELKSGNGVTVEETVTKPTVYGKLLQIINKKVKNGVSLTPDEEAVVQEVTTNPEEFVKPVTKSDIIKYDPKAAETAAAPAAGGEATTIQPALPPAVKPAPDLAPINLPAGIGHPSEVAAPTITAPRVETPKGSLKPLKQPKPEKPTVIKPKATGTITTYSGHQGRGSAFSTTDKQFATQFANEDASGNEVKGVVTTKKLNKADILDTREPADRLKLESVLGKENVDKLVESSGNGLPAHMDKGEQDALVEAAKRLGFKHIALSETDAQTKYNGSDVVSYVDTSGDVTKEVTQAAKGAVKPLSGKATAELRYPATSKLPSHLKENVPMDQKKFAASGKQVPKEKLTTREASHVGGQEILWERTKVAELMKLIPGLKENPIMKLKATSDGLQLTAKIGNHEFSIPAKSIGLSEERMTAAGLKNGDTIDISGALEKGASNVPIIKRGKTMFSGTSGGNEALPKAMQDLQDSLPEGYRVDKLGSVFDKDGKELTSGQLQDLTQPKWLSDFEKARNEGDTATMKQISDEHPGDARVHIEASYSGTTGASKPKAAVPAEKPEPEAPVPVKHKPSNPVKKFLDETAKNKEVAGKLDDQLHALGGNSVADNVALSKLFKDVKKSNVTAEDWAAIYHYAEDHSAPITDLQRGVYDGTVKPLQDSINDMRTDMGLKPFKNDEFIHRIAQGKGGSLERFLEGDSKDISAGNVLKKTSDSMKTRTWMKLVDDKGNSHIVSIKSPKNKLGKAMGERQVTAFKNGKKMPMGALKRKIPTPTTEFNDPVLMEQLNKIATGLGIKHERTNMPLKRGDTAAGVHYGGTNIVKTKAASAPDTLLHEIGHYIDHKYDLQGQFLGRIADKTTDAEKEEQRTITQELRDLADKRVGDVSSKSFTKYVRTGEEKMAVMFQAYLHAPEIFKAVAPVTFDKFEGFLKSHAETKPIANIEKSLQLGKDVIGDVRHEGEFIDKTGKKWKIVNATTKEIEDNTNTRYYKQPLVSTAIDYMQTRQALRASQFLDKWKESPDFLYKEHEDGTTTGIAVKSDSKNIPDGWKTTTAMQFKGYYFEPRTAEVLDDFARTAAKGDPLGAFTGMNLFLRNTIFFNPLMHVPNIAVHALMRRGVSGFVNPVRLVRATTSSIQALNELIHKGSLYQSLLREGAPLMSFDRTGLSKMIGKMMDDTIQDDKAVSTLAKLTGYADKANFIKAWYKVSSGITWGSHDFFMLQAMIEEMKKGLTPQEAIHEVSGHIPDYRLPTRFLGSRSLKTTLANHNVTMFLPYHYGILKSYANTIREITGHAPRGGKEEPGFTGHAKTSARGLDKLLMFGVIMFIIYPELDKLAKKLTGDDNAIQRRAGVATIPYAIYRMLTGKRSIQSTATLVLPTPPGTKGAIQLLRNRDDLNRQIWNPSDAFNHPATAAKDILHFVGGTVAPVQQAQRAQKGQLNGKGFVENLVGISTPNDTKSLVSKLYSQQLNLGVQTKVQQRENDRKNAARDQIAAGKGDDLAKKLVTDGILKKEKLKDFEKTAAWTPEQRTFDNLSAVNKLLVFQKSPPKDWPELGDLKQVKKDAAKTAADKNASGANRAAAGDIVKILSGDTNNFSYASGKQTTDESILASVGAYASAFKTSPLTAFNRIFTGQRIIRTNNGAIIVERMPVGASQGIKQKLGGKNASMKLDHTVPLELGGSNDESNLKLVTTATWASYTPVEDYLGKQLAANKITAKEAQRKIKAFKNGTMKSSEIIGH